MPHNNFSFDDKIKNKHQSWKDKGLKTEEIVVSDTQGTGWEKRESRESVSERHKKNDDQ